MRIASLGSGSSGNATLIDSGSGLLMVDCGFSLTEVERRLEAIGSTISDIAAILVTHEHSDHLSGVARLARRYHLPIYLTHGTAQRLPADSRLHCHTIRADQPFQILGLDIHPVPVPHDAREPVQFVLCRGNTKVGVLTDLGSLTPRILELYRDCQMMLVEANHDMEMLMSGPYPMSLKKRVGGRWGHLNNGQTAELLRAINVSARLHTLVLGHISRQNNHPDRVQAAVGEVVRDVDQIHYALQDETLGWIDCVITQEAKMA